jgi:lysozyme family protein
VITALHELGTYAAQAESVASAVEVLVRAWTGAPAPPPILTQGSATSFLNQAVDAAAGLTALSIFGGLESALAAAASAAQPLSSAAVSTASTALTAFSQLGQHVAASLSGTGVQHAA